MDGIADTEYRSHVMLQVLAACRQAARTDSIVLLQGETGTGKDFLARYIHDHSRRSVGLFLPVNCAAIAPELAESEFFGHERGAFTGAVGRKKGLLEQANGGTSLLTEIGRIGLTLQAKLLTFFDYHQFMRVGGERPVKVDVRIIAASSRNLEQLVLEGLFLSDLLHRLNVFPIWIPPLREHKEDIPVLVRTLLSRLSFEMKLGYKPTLDSPALERLASHDWPGNVRELRNILERALVLTHGNSIIGEKAIILALSGTKKGPENEVIVPPEKPGRLEISDEQLKQMIEEVFGGAPTPVVVLMEVLGWTRKKTSVAIKRVGCRPGKSGRLPERMKAEMIRDVRSWLSKRGIL